MASVLARSTGREANDVALNLMQIGRDGAGGPAAGSLNQEQIRSADEALKRDVEAFGLEIDKIKMRNLAPSQHTVMLSQTPLVLSILGADVISGKQAVEGGLYISGHTISDAINGVHSVTLDMLKQLPEAMADPIAIFDSETRQGSGDIVFMLELKDADGRTVVVPVALGGRKGSGPREINIVKSAYGKGNNKPITQWFIDQAGKNSRYINEQKIAGWAKTSGVQFPFRSSNQHGNSIHTDADLVKLRQANPTLYQYAGPKSNLTEGVRERLREARILAEGGADNEAVRQKTGWFQGMDGQWRYEIADKLYEIDFTLFEKLETNRLPLGDIYDNRELYAAYPDLKRLEVQVGTPLNQNGNYSAMPLKNNFKKSKKVLDKIF
jgi:hypothetical protein